jgi:hypothetical protein
VLSLVKWRGLTLAVALLFVVQGVQAAPPASQPSAAVRLVVHTFAEGNAGALARTVQRGLVGALEKESRVAATSLESHFGDPAADDTLIADAEGKLTAARQKMDELELAEATKLVKAAIASYEKALPRLAQQPKPMAPLVQALKLMAAARFIDGDAEGAREALRRARSLDADLAYDAKLFPPKMRRMFTEVKLLLDELGKGALAVQSDPSGAEVLLDGAPAGTTPLRIASCGSGAHYLTFLAPAVPPMTVLVEVTGGEEKKVDQALARFDDDPVPVLDRARMSTGEITVSAALRELARRVKADLLLLGNVAEEKEGARVSFYLYDLRTGRLAKQVKRAVPTAELATTAAAAVAEMDPGRVALNPESAEGPTALHPTVGGFFLRTARKWRGWHYFWHSVAVIGGVALVSTIVGVAVASQPRGLDPRYGAIIASGRGLGLSF